MSWPWVSRALLDEAVAARHAAERNADWWSSALKAADDRLVSANLRYDELLAKYHALRATPIGNTVTMAAPVEGPPSAPPQQVDELAALIAEVCAGDYTKQRIMLRQLAVDRAAKVEEDVIRAAILAGVQTDGVPL